MDLYFEIIRPRKFLNGLLLLVLVGADSNSIIVSGEIGPRINVFLLRRLGCSHLGRWRSE